MGLRPRVLLDYLRAVGRAWAFVGVALACGAVGAAAYFFPDLQQKLGIPAYGWWLLGLAALSLGQFWAFKTVWEDRDFGLAVAEKRRQEERETARHREGRLTRQIRQLETEVTELGRAVAEPDERIEEVRDSPPAESPREEDQARLPLFR